MPASEPPYMHVREAGLRGQSLTIDPKVLEQLDIDLIKPLTFRIITFHRTFKFDIHGDLPYQTPISIELLYTMPIYNIKTF